MLSCKNLLLLFLLLLVPVVPVSLEVWLSEPPNLLALALLWGGDGEDEGGVAPQELRHTHPKKGGAVRPKPVGGEEAEEQGPGGHVRPELSQGPQKGQVRHHNEVRLPPWGQLGGEVICLVITEGYTLTTRVETEKNVKIL